MIELFGSQSAENWSFWVIPFDEVAKMSEASLNGSVNTRGVLYGIMSQCMSKQELQRIHHVELDVIQTQKSDGLVARCVSLLALCELQSDFGFQAHTIEQSQLAGNRGIERYRELDVLVNETLLIAILLPKFPSRV
jgi:hypothetical protein